MRGVGQLTPPGQCADSVGQRITQRRREVPATVFLEREDRRTM